jgi:AAA ATPase domain
MRPRSHPAVAAGSGRYLNRSLILAGVDDEGGGGRIAEQLVGRAEELAVLAQRLAELRGGAACAVAVSGEPGIGKSRLLVELERLAEQHGHLVLSGRASELESDLPYWIFVDALDEHLRSLDRVDRIDRRLGGELARIFPTLAGFGDRSGAVLDERYRARRAVRELLERWRPPARWCSRWTTCTGPIPPRSSSSAGSYGARRMRGSCWCWPCAPARRRPAWRPRWSRPPGPDRCSAWSSVP